MKFVQEWIKPSFNFQKNRYFIKTIKSPQQVTVKIPSLQAGQANIFLSRMYPVKFRNKRICV